MPSENDSQKNALFSLQHVWKHKRIFDNGTINELTVLSDVVVDFCGGCVQMILGPSGSGKTTLLRLLNRLESPDRGKIIYHQTDLTAIPARQLRKEIGMVFQTPALFRGTVFDNIAYGPRLANDSMPNDRAAELLKLVGLAELDSSRNVETLSIGQQQRVSCARALANEPKMLLLDEPTSALDPSAAKNLLDLIQKINRELGVSVIMVTHVMEHAQRIADTVCLLHEGRVIESGTAKSFFDHPQTEIAQKFIAGEL